MTCSSKFNFLLLMCSISLLLILFACAGPKGIPENERRYIEGFVVEGGKSGFRMKVDSGNIIRFAHRDDIEYQPLEFHAYYGDRVGVTFYTKIKSNKEVHKALRIVLIKTNPNRIDFRSGAFNGIVRARGMMRSLVHWPEKDLTIAFYKKGTPQYSPKGWRPEKGSRVKISISENSQRFYRILSYNQINSLGEDLVPIQDKMETGVITEIYVHRGVKRAPDRFAFQLGNGDTLTIYGGGETKLVPKDLIVLLNETYSIEYYRLLLGDQSLRYVATKIEKARYY